MGMFDQPSGKPWADNYSVGDQFVLLAVKLVPGVVTSFGTGTMAVLTIDGEDFTIFGRGIVGQIENMEDGDLPARVKIALMPPKKGQSSMKLIVPANTATDENHIIIPDAPATPAKNGSDDIPF